MKPAATDQVRIKVVHFEDIVADSLWDRALLLEAALVGRRQSAIGEG